MFNIRWFHVGGMLFGISLSGSGYFQGCSLTNKTMSRTPYIQRLFLFLHQWGHASTQDTVSSALLLQISFCGRWMPMRAELVKTTHPPTTG